MRLVKGLIQRCAETVELMATAPSPSRLSEIASALDMPKSAAHRLLQELQALGWVEQQGSEGPYQLTVRFALLGHRVLHASRLPDLVRPVLEELAVRSRELVRLTMATQGSLAWFASAQGAPPGLLYQPEMNGPVRLFATANGKAYLATLDEAAALQLAREDGLGTVRPTPRSHQSGRALLADLRAVRKRGYAVAEEEAEVGVSAVSVAVCRARQVLGTLSVAGPTARIMPRETGLALDLQRTAATLASTWPTSTPMAETPA